jgi:hypothetical protein
MKSNVFFVVRRNLFSSFRNIIAKRSALIFRSLQEVKEYVGARLGGEDEELRLSLEIEGREVEEASEEAEGEEIANSRSSSCDIVVG